MIRFGLLVCLASAFLTTAHAQDADDADPVGVSAEPAVQSESDADYVAIGRPDAIGEAAPACLASSAPADDTHISANTREQIVNVLLELPESVHVPNY